MRTPIHIVFLLLFVLSACEDKNNKKLEKEGFLEVNAIGAFHFVLVDEKFWGDRSNQLRYGNQLCAKNKQSRDYCEVYFFANAEDIPESFPIINRKNHLGLFQIKDGKRKIKTLPRVDDSESKIVVFFKNIYKKYIVKNINGSKVYIEDK